MNINYYILQDVLKNTSLSEQEINFQFQQIINSFISGLVFDNILYRYLRVHFPMYLRTVYNISVPSKIRNSTNLDSEFLLMNGVLANQGIVNAIFSRDEENNVIVQQTKGEPLLDEYDKLIPNQEMTTIDFNEIVNNRKEEVVLVSDTPTYVPDTPSYSSEPSSIPSVDYSSPSPSSSYGSSSSFD